jgi:hypothetical protein
MKVLDQNFESTKEFDRTVIKDLANFFDFDFLNKNPEEYQLWFANLKKLAFQNLGLAHSVIHNQTAQNCALIAFKETGREEFNRLYTENIAGHTFLKLFSEFKPDSITYDGKTLSGIKHWISNLETADFVVVGVVNSASKLKKTNYIFIDLNKVEHKISGGEYHPIGLNVARPFNLELNIEISEHWVITNENNSEEFNLASYFHFYALIINYIMCSKNLLQLLKHQNYNVEYELKKLGLNLKISEALLDKSLENLLFDKSNKTKFYMFDNQYQFARKNLIDITKFFLEIGNSSLLDVKSQASQVVRDSIMMTSHLVNLYKHIDGVVTRYY